MVDDMDDPGPRRSFGRIEQGGFLINVEKCFLYGVFRFAGISQDAACNSQSNPGIAVKQQSERGGIARLEPTQNFFV